MFKKLSKLFIIMFACIYTFCNTIPISASVEHKDIDNSNFSLIECLKENPVNTKEEFISLILKNGNVDVTASISTPCKAATIEEIDSFSYIIDEERQLVYVETIKYGNETTLQSTRSARTIYQKTGSVSHETYSDVGLLLFTITTEGTFQYDKSSYCEYIKGHGYYNPGSLGLYESSPETQNGNYSTTKAFIETYGTATCNVPIADTLGIIITLHSINYSLELTCNYMGEFEGYYSEQIIS